MFVAVIIAFFTLASSSSGLELEIRSGRPLKDALVILAQELNCIITYEDAPFQHVDDMVPAFEGATVAVPRGGTISFKSQSNDPIIEVIESLINEYSRQGNPGTFKVFDAYGMFHVVPTQYKGRSGKATKNRSILDVEISVRPSSMNCDIALIEVCKAANNVNPQFDLKIFGSPDNLMRNIPLRSTAGNKKAFDFLAEILTAVNSSQNPKPLRPITWLLLYGPLLQPKKEKDYYALNVIGIPKANLKPVQLRVEHTRPMSETAKIIEKRFDISVTYEDPIYECPYEIMGGKEPIGGIIRVGWSEEDDVESVLNKVFRAGIQPRPDPETFGYERGTSAFHIFPLTSKNIDGVPVERTSVMGTPITFEIESGPGTKQIDAFCNALTTASGSEVRLGTLPPNVRRALSRPMGDYATQDTKARDFLSDYLAEIDAQLSWQLIFKPEFSIYELNIYRRS